VDTCNIVGNDTLDRCWYNLYTTNETISKSNLANHPSGTQTTIKLKVESGSENIQTAGTYQGTIIITTVAN
jgi:spore coat protein U-like protein